MSETPVPSTEFTVHVPDSDHIGDASISTPDDIELSENAPPKRSRKGLIIASSVAGALLALAAASIAGYSYYYADKALPGTSIAGHDISGMTQEQVAELLNTQTQKTVLSFQVAGHRVEAPAEEYGLTFNNDQTVTNAFAPSSKLISQLAALFRNNEVTPSITLDDQKLGDFAEKLAREAGPTVKQASVIANADGSFEISPAVTGKAVDKEKLVTAINTQAQSLTASEIITEVVDLEPTITNEMAQASVDDAQALAAREVSVTDGIDIFSSDIATRSKWVIVPESSDGKTLETPRFDRTKVKEWVEKTANDSNVEPLPTYNNVDANGKILVEGAKPGRKGYKANNVDKITDDILAASSKAEPFAGEFSYDEIAPPVENRQVLPGAENMAYPAAAGEKWLEINLGNNTVSAYIGTDRVRGPIGIVPGAPGTETVTGLFHIYLKFVKQDMGCTPEWPYCAKDVPWVSYFHGSYAFHGAPWHQTFGWSGPAGSHGCVNMPVPEAQWIHEWADMGTPVASHY